MPGTRGPRDRGNQGGLQCTFFFRSLLRPCRLARAGLSLRQRLRCAPDFPARCPRVIPSMKQALLIVDHGSRRPEANASLAQMAELLRSMLPDRPVHFAHMELAPPDLEAGFAACVRDGAEEVIVQPFMLSAGRHAAEDIPRLAAEAAARRPGLRFRVTPPLGVHEKLAELVLLRAELSEFARDAD